MIVLKMLKPENSSTISKAFNSNSVKKEEKKRKKA